MQWNHGKNFGFSEALEDQIYLPVDPSPDAPCTADQIDDETSLLAETRRLTDLRHRYEDIQADAAFEVIRAEEDAPFVYRRGSLILALNPSSKHVSWSSDLLEGRHIAYKIGSAGMNAGTGTDGHTAQLSLGSQSFVVLEK